MSINHEDIDRGSSDSCGFIFAFYQYSKSSNKHLWEKFVSLATGSDFIHVGIIPVVHATLKKNTFCKEQEISILDKVYTAFIGKGFVVQSVSNVLNPAYDFIYCPVEDIDCFYKGIAFLEGFNGCTYNYSALPFTVLPKLFKEIDDSSSLKTLKNSLESHHYSKIICSQLGLLLMYECNIPTSQTLNPKYCTPGELFQILCNNPKSYSCTPRSFKIVSDVFQMNKHF